MSFWKTFWILWCCLVLRDERFISASKMDLGGPSGGDSCLWPPVGPDLHTLHWPHPLTNRQQRWSRSSLVNKIKHCRSNGNYSNYKLCRRLWNSTPALTHELGWRQSNVRSVWVTLWLWCPFFTQYRVGNSKHLRQWMKLMNDLDILIDPVLNTFCQYKQIKLFKQKNSFFFSKHKHSHIHLKKKSSLVYVWNYLVSSV